MLKMSEVLRYKRYEPIQTFFSIFKISINERFLLVYLFLELCLAG